MKRHRVLQAERFEIVDQDGQARMILSVDDGCPCMELLDSSGHLRATLYVGPQGEPGLAFGRNTKDINLLLYVDRNGAPQIRLRQTELESHVIIHTVPAPSITLNDGLSQIVMQTPEHGEVGLNRPPLLP